MSEIPKIKLFGEPIELSQRRLNYVSIRKFCVKHSRGIATEFVELAKEYTSSLYSLINKADLIAQVALEPAIDKIVSYYLNNGVYNITKDDVLDTILNNEAYIREFQKLVNAYNNITNEALEEKAMREANAANRGRWQGGGFGLGGAIKGAITAEALNVVSGAVHGIANSIGNARSDAKRDRELSSFYRHPDTFGKIASALEFATRSYYLVLGRELERQASIGIEWITTADAQEAKNIFKNVANPSLREDVRKEMLTHVLELDPYFMSPYVYIFEHYDLTEKTAILELADVFDIDLNDSITKYASGKEPSEITSLEEAYQQKQNIVDKLAELDIDDHELLDIMDERIIELKLEDYTRQITAAETTQALNGIRDRFNGEEDFDDDEKAALSKVADEADTSLRTFMDIVFSSQEEAVNQKRIYNEARLAFENAQSSEEFKSLKQRVEAAEHEASIKSDMLNKLDEAILSAELKEIRELAVNITSNNEEIDAFLAEIRTKDYTEKAIQKTEHELGLLKNYADFLDKTDIFNKYFELNELTKQPFDRKVILTYSEANIGTLASQASSRVASMKKAYYDALKKYVIEAGAKKIAQSIDLTPSDISDNCVFLFYGDKDFGRNVKDIRGYREDKYDKPIFAAKSTCYLDIIVCTFSLFVNGIRFDITPDLDIRIPSGLLKSVKISQGEQEYEMNILSPKLNKNVLHMLLTSVGIVNELIAGITSIDDKGGAFNIYCDIAEKFGRFIDDPEKIVDVIYYYKSNSSYSDTDKLVFSVNDEQFCSKLSEIISGYDLEQIRTLKRSVDDKAAANGFRIDALDAVLTRAENAYIAKYMTFRGVAYPSISEKQTAEKKYADAEALYTSCDKEKYTSIVEAVMSIHSSAADKVAADIVEKLATDADNIISKTDDADTLRSYEKTCEALVQKYNTPVTTLMREKAHHAFEIADGRERTYNGVLYDTVELRDHAQRSDEEIVQTMRATDFKDAVMVFAAFEKINSSDYSEDIVAKYIQQLRDSCTRCLAQTKDVPTLAKLCDILKASPCADNAEISAMLAEAESTYTTAELASRTYKGVEFESVEQIEVGKQEEQTCELIMRSVSKDNPNSIKTAETQINELTTPIKQIYLNKLAEMTAQYESSLRTYRGVEYGSAEEAQAAENEYKAARDLCRTVDRNDIDSVQRIHDQLCEGKYGTAKEFIDELNGILVKYDIAYRTVDGILFDTREEADLARTEYQQLEQLMAGVNTDDEQNMLSARQTIDTMRTAVKDKYLTRIDDLLNKYDIKCRTFNGKVYDTREIVQVLNKEQADIQSIWTTVSQENEESMLNAKDRFAHMETFLKDAEIAKIDRMLQKYDIGIRTVRNVQYPTREEAATVRREYEIIDEVMATVDPENEATILDAQQKIGALTTNVKAPYIDKLNKMWSTLDLKLRTFEKFVFDTREQAVHAKTTKEEFLTRFNTLNLLDINNIYQLENYIEDELNEKIRPEVTAMVNDVKDILANIDTVVSKNQTTNPEANKKESADLYKLAEKTVSRMKKYNMDTTAMDEIMQRHYGSLNVGQKLFSFIKKKF